MKGGTLSVPRGWARFDYVWLYLKFLKLGVNSSFKFISVRSHI